MQALIDLDDDLPPCVYRLQAPSPKSDPAASSVRTDVRHWWQIAQQIEFARSERHIHAVAEHAAALWIDLQPVVDP